MLPVPYLTIRDRQINPVTELLKSQQEAGLDHTVYCGYCPGYCCYRLDGATLFVDAADINRIARHFEIADGEARRRYIEGRNTFKLKRDGSCIFLNDTKMRARCTIHQARPRQCRDFPYGKPCPYLNREDLLASIQPRVEMALCGQKEEQVENKENGVSG